MTIDAGDPFGEHRALPFQKRLSVLGADCHLRSTNREPLALAVAAFGGLPRHRLAGPLRRLDVRLLLNTSPRSWARNAAPPRPRLTSGAGLLCATVDAGNLVIVDPERACAVVCLSRSLLRHPYHARYELIEFALLTLAARVQSLVPLHAACLGRNGRGVLLMGGSGAGKSTIALQALARGLQLLGEDSAFVTGDDLLITGTPNYLHVQESTLTFLAPGPLQRQILSAEVIERRSGVRKFEVDLRDLQGRRAPGPLRAAATVFLSRRPAGKQPAMRPLDRKTLRERLRGEQPYAAGLSNWQRFERRLLTLPGFELRRTAHPDTAAREISALLNRWAPP